MKGLAAGYVALMLFLALVNSVPVRRASGALQTTAGVLRIYGSVNTPLNLTYDELVSFPMVSEVAELLCVMGWPDVTYNWTGIPLFYLLTLAQIRPEAVKVVTRGAGYPMFESDLFVEDALRPTTILALGANGAGLPEISGIQGLYRLVVPCNYGYKWVGDVQEIEVVTDPEYKGTYERSGWNDTADVPNCGPLPAQNPPLQTFDLVYGNRTFGVDAFTNASVDALAFDHFQKALNINMTVPEGASGFADFILQQDFLRGPYNVLLDGKPIYAGVGNTVGVSYVGFSVGGGFHVASILGTEFFGHIPQIVVDYNATTYLGQNATFDASKSFDYGRIVSYEWSFGDGTNASGAVVLHSFDEVGTYLVKLNVTNAEGISNFETLTSTVENPPGYFPPVLYVFLASTLALLVLMLAFLLRSRKSVSPSETRSSTSGSRTAFEKPTSLGTS